MQRLLVDDLSEFIDPSWPPMAHVRRGADRLGPEGRALVAGRVREALGRFRAPAGREAPLRRFFSFLSQVEVIAIEVPLSAMPTARPEVLPLLERQLADEVFHATLFAALAKRLGGLDRPLPEAERLLDQIRAQEDPRTTAVLLNLLAEGWIENLFDHAATWGVCDDVFRIVLEDEARHVEEAHAHAEGLDLAAVEQAVRRFEDDLFRLVEHPRVLLPTLALAGEARFRALGDSFLRVHKEALAEVGLRPAATLSDLEAAFRDVEAAGEGMAAPPRPTPIEPESQWRRTAMELWDAPRNPSMSGWIEVRVDHVPRRHLTAVLVAAVGKVWAEYPRMNRYAHGGQVWQPATVNVGVRVAIGDKGEALSTVPIVDADKRSVRDVQRILAESVKRLDELGGRVQGIRPDPEAEALSSVLRDEELMRMVPPETVTCPVTISNVGKMGLYAGFGAMPGALGQSVEMIVGRIEKRPQWRGWRYKPTDTVILGCTADHRVVDGTHAAEGMRRLREALSPEGVAEILARPDTLPEGASVPPQAMAAFERSALALSCKAPFWLGWLCWLLKK